MLVSKSIIDGNRGALWRYAGGGGPYPDGAPDAATHLRNVFYRMGLTDQEIVVLSGAHTLGRSYPNRSGFGKLQSSARTSLFMHVTTSPCCLVCVNTSVVQGLSEAACLSRSKCASFCCMRQQLLCLSREGKDKVHGQGSSRRCHCWRQLLDQGVAQV